MFRRFPTPARGALLVLGVCALAGGLGALPGARGALDPVALLGWLTLFAPAAGVLCVGHGAAFFPFALAVPATWLLLFVFLLGAAPLTLATPMGAAAALLGFFAFGCALGRRSRAPVRHAGLVLLGMLALSSACVGFGFLADGSALARGRPGLARALLDLSPLVCVFDCAGWDWSHAQPAVYAGAGVEWFQRRPWPATLMGPGLLVVGCILALLVPAPRPPSTEG